MTEKIKMQDTINQLAVNKQALTMSSREIATLCDKEHRNVCRDVTNLNLEYEKLSLLKIEQCEYVADNGQTYREFLLTKEQTIDIITGYRTDLRIRINRRWQELEQAQSPIPQTYPDALRAYADEVEKRMELEHQAKLNAPKVAHYDLVANRTNLVNATQVASKIKMSAKALNRHLDKLGVYNKTVRRNKRTFNLWFIDSGLGQMIQSGKGFDQALFTHKGEAWVFEQLAGVGAIA